VIPAQGRKYDADANQGNAEAEYRRGILPADKGLKESQAGFTTAQANSLTTMIPANKAMVEAEAKLANERAGLTNQQATNYKTINVDLEREKLDKAVEMSRDQNAANLLKAIRQQEADTQKQKAQLEAYLEHARITAAGKQDSTNKAIDDAMSGNKSPAPTPNQAAPAPSTPAPAPNPTMGPPAPSTPAPAPTPNQPAPGAPVRGPLAALRQTSSANSGAQPQFDISKSTTPAEDYKKIPSGAIYIGLDGQQRRKL
jgi:hypothetical protein